MNAETLVSDRMIGTRIQVEAGVGVHRINDSYVNWYLIEEGHELTVIDAGLTDSWDTLHVVLRQLGRAPEDIKAIVLTHAHFDHVGFAERARQRYGIPVWAHVSEVSQTRHPLRYQHERSRLLYLWRPSVLEVIGSFVAWGALWTQAIGEVKTFRDGDTLDVPGSPEVVFTPGHTLGHCSFHLPQRDVLLSGDALVTYEPYTNQHALRLVARAATANSRQAMLSLERLARTGATLVLPGHGEPWDHGIDEAVYLASRAGIC